MGHFEKPIVCYVTDRRALGAAQSNDTTAVLLAKIRLAAQARADWIQVREKDLAGGRLLTLAREAIAAVEEVAKAQRGNAPACRGGPFRRTRVYVNDRLDAALTARAERLPDMAGLPPVAGVHLGGESLPVEEVVHWCRAGNAPREFQIGVSCHSIDDARTAERDGADYIFFGPIFDTPSKRGFGPPQGLDRLHETSKAVRVPVIAIGGIDDKNAADCIRAGASGIAAIRLFQETGEIQELNGFVSAVHGLEKEEIRR